MQTPDDMITAVSAAFTTGVLQADSIGLLVRTQRGVEIHRLDHLRDDEIRAVVPALVQAAPRREYGIIRRTEVDGVSAIALYLERLGAHGLLVFDPAGLRQIDRDSPDAADVDWASFFPGGVRPPRHEPSRN
jgi:hypothetical protein